MLAGWLILADIARALASSQGAGQLRTGPVCLFVSSSASSLMQEDSECIMVARGPSQRVKSKSEGGWSRVKLGMLSLRAGGTEVAAGQMEAGKPVLAQSLPMSFIKSNKAASVGLSCSFRGYLWGPCFASSSVLGSGCSPENTTTGTCCQGEALLLQWRAESGFFSFLFYETPFAASL